MNPQNIKKSWFQTVVSRLPYYHTFIRRSHPEDVTATLWMAAIGFCLSILNTGFIIAIICTLV